MLAKAEVAKLIEEILEVEGWSVYEMEFFPSKSTVVQVFVTGKDKAVSIQDCVRLSKKIRRDERLVSFFEEFGLEMSSPGLDRKLKKAEHFAGAIGEHVKLVFKFGPFAGQKLAGVLQSFENSVGQLASSSNAGLISFALADVKSAQVDFVPVSKGKFKK